MQEGGRTLTHDGLKRAEVILGKNGFLYLQQVSRVHEVRVQNVYIKVEHTLIHLRENWICRLRNMRSIVLRNYFMVVINVDK